RQSRTGRSQPLSISISGFCAIQPLCSNQLLAWIRCACSHPRALDQSASRSVKAVAVGTLGKLAGDLLAKLDTELIERVDPEQHAVGECAMLVEGNQRPKRSRVEPVEQHGRAWTIAGIGALRIVAL